MPPANHPWNQGGSLSGLQLPKGWAVVAILFLSPNWDIHLNAAYYQVQRRLEARWGSARIQRRGIAFRLAVLIFFWLCVPLIGTALCPAAELRLSPPGASKEGSVELVCELAGEPAAALQFDLVTAPGLHISVQAIVPDVIVSQSSLSAGTTRVLVLRLDGAELPNAGLLRLVASGTGMSASGSYALKFENMLAATARGDASRLDAAGTEIDLVAPGSTQFLPLWSAGGGWSTSIRLLNLSAAPQSPRIQLGDDSGGEAVPSASDATQLPPHGLRSVQIGPFDRSEITTGWAEVTLPGGVAATSQLEFVDAAGRRSAVSIPLQQNPNGAFALLFDNTKGADTYFVLLNPDPGKTVRLALSFHGEDGELMLDTVLEVPARRREFFRSGYRFPGIGGHTGSVRVLALTENGVYALTLQTSPDGALTLGMPIGQ